MKRLRQLLLLLSILLIGLSWWGIIAARSGLVVRSFEQESIPLMYLAPQQAQAVPGVLIAHGYAGSKQLMLGYAHVLARAGYATMLWDFDGHGANSNQLQRFELQQNLNVALNVLLKQPEVDRTRLALLGHSMGSGIVMSAGIEQVLFAAAIAVSPTGASVTSQAPRNLQLQAGSWEGRFIANAQQLLAAGGGSNDNFAAGTARELVIVPNAEHITILFNDASHQAALRWLNATFNQSSTSNYVDRRMGWYGLHLLGWLDRASILCGLDKVEEQFFIANLMECP
ncbi:alpha/beta hydrolase, partial [Gloeocapsopsis dulcis]